MEKFIFCAAMHISTFSLVSHVASFLNFTDTQKDTEL